MHFLNSNIKHQTSFIKKLIYIHQDNFESSLHIKQHQYNQKKKKTYDETKE
jgi:hypothetical protein